MRPAEVRDRDTVYAMPGLVPILDADQLQTALGGPSLSAGVNTIRDHLAPVDSAWLAACGLWFMSTASPSGSCDCTLRGDQPGAVYVLDDAHIVLPERAGNRRGDSYHNLLGNPGVGLIFVIPGRLDTLRINGWATMVSDAPWYDDLTVDGTRPPLAIIVSVVEIFYHCVKGLRRSGVWEPYLWIPTAAPSRRAVAAALSGVLGLEVTCEA